MLPHPNCEPVFFDRLGKRARRFGIVVRLGVVAFSALTGVYLSGILRAPSLATPELPIAVVSAPSPVADTYAQPTLRRIAASYRSLPTGAPAVPRFALVRVGDEASMAQLHEHAKSIDAVVLDALKVDDVSGIARIAVAPLGSETVKWLRRNAGHIGVHVMVRSIISPERLATLIATPDQRQQFVTAVVSNMRALRGSGIVLDLREFPTNSHAHVVKLLDDLRRGMAGGQVTISIIVNPGMPANRLRTVAAMATFIMAPLTISDAERSADAAPAPQGWFETELARLCGIVDPAKLIVVIGTGAIAPDPSGAVQAMSVQAAWDLARSHGATITLDPTNLNSTFTYVTTGGMIRRVWLLDAVTAFNHARAALGSGVAGLAVADLGYQDPSVWGAIGRGRTPDGSAFGALERPRAISDVFERVDLDLFRTKPGVPGERRLNFDPALGLITAARMLDMPRFAEVSGLKAIDPKAVALTFDDGPDPLATPKILDILAQKEVKATFYVVGAASARHPDILQRIYAEGHDIGNHSYSHPDLGMLGAREIARDLNATQRVLEAQLGANTTLFRAPYAITSYREMVRAPHIAETVSDLGYLVGGINVNSRDYLPFRSAAQIHQQVVAETLRLGRGATVLLHDGAGSRLATIAALGPIIDDLRSHGFRFVSTHELVGLPRDTVMPPRGSGTIMDGASTAVRARYTEAFARIADVVGLLAIGTAVIGIVRILFVTALAMCHRRREAARASTVSGPALVAVLVPGYNEESVICKTVASLLDSTFGDRIEVVVIDDGSKDRTSEVVRKAYADDPRVRVFRKENGGKSAALNFGIMQTDADIIVAIDADTLLERDAIELLVRHFGDPRIGAVAGNAVVGNQCNMITRMQALEYVTSQNLERRALEMINAISVIPGAIGAWRRSALIEAGCYGNDTLAEDADLTIAIERLGWKVIYEPRARALTEAPETVAAFLKQRFRWMFGTLQVACKHLRHPRGLPVGLALVTLPNVIVFAFAFTLLAPVVDALLLVTLGTMAWNLISDGATLQHDTLWRISAYWLVFQCVDVAIAWLGLCMDSDRSNRRLVGWVIVQRFTYRQLLYWVALRALLAAIKGHFVGWGKLVRTGSVTLTPAQQKTI